MVAGWGAYLVPFWVRRHDGPAAEMRSIQGFSTAMRTLSRRKPGYVDGRYVVMPRTRAKSAVPEAVHVSGASVRTAADHRLIHRRQALFSLMVMSVVSAPLAFLVGGLTVWLLAGSMATTLGYAVALRRETVRARERARRARQLARRHKTETAREEYRLRVEAAAAAAAAAAARPARQPLAARYVPEQSGQPAEEYVEDWQRVVGQ
ncbi:MAG: hypothetical protein ABI912_09900 [Actinomycetota bacterium]